MSTHEPSRRRRIAVFDPTPILTVVVEDLDGRADVHVHAGGQGVWVARMAVELGVEAVLCAPVGGETGEVLAALAVAEGIALRPTPTPGSCGAYIADRRSGTREELVSMPPDPLGRHVLDELYGTFLSECVVADVSVLTGPREPGALPADTYRRLAGDCAALHKPLVVDLSGDALAAALAGRIGVLKVSHVELQEAGELGPRPDEREVLDAARRLHDKGAAHVVISRGANPAVALIDGEPWRAFGPVLTQADHRGSGDAMTAGIAAALASGRELVDALRLGVAAGAVNVSRHGLATADRESVGRILDAVVAEPIDGPIDEPIDGPADDLETVAAQGDES